MAENLTDKIIITEALVEDYEQREIQALKFEDIDWAREFIRKIWPQVETDKSLSQSQSELYKRLKRLYHINLILFASALTEKELLNLFTLGINTYFQEMINDYDLWPRVRGYLVGLFHEDRDPLKEKIRQVLLLNEELITKGRIERNDKTYSPTIAQWLIDYTSVVGAGKVDTLAMNQYFTSSKNFQKLSNDDKERVRKLIEFYERLKRSSLDPDGIEEQMEINIDGEILVLKDGRLEVAYREGKEPTEKKLVDVLTEPPVVSQPTQEVQSIEKEVLAAYQGDLRRQKSILKEEEKFRKKYGSDISGLREEFFKIVQKQDVNRTIACLRALAQLGSLINFLKDDPKLNKFLAAIWEKQYSVELAGNFKQNPTELVFVRMFLQYVLQQRLGMSINDAARVGMQIGNIFASLGQKEYNKMAYFDIKTKSFGWFE